MSIAPQVTADFEAGTNGSSISGLTGVSGVGGTAPTVTTTSPIFGTKSAISDAGAVSSFMTQTFSGTPNDIVSTCHYFTYDGTPPATINSILRIMQDSSNSNIQVRMLTDGRLEVIDFSSNQKWVSPSALTAGDYGIFVAVTKGTTTSNGVLSVWCRKKSDDSTIGTDLINAACNSGTAQFTLVRHGKTGTGGKQHKWDYACRTLGTHDKINSFSDVAPPTVSAGSDQTVEAYDPINVLATSTEATATWTRVSGPAAVITPVGSKGASVAVAPTTTTQTLVLRASSTNAGGTTTDDMTVTIRPAARCTISGAPIQRVTL